MGDLTADAVVTGTTCTPAQVADARLSLAELALATPDPAGSLQRALEVLGLGGDDE